MLFISRVTILKDKVTRRSRGVAFVLFLKPEDAVSCAKALNKTEVLKPIYFSNGLTPRVFKRLRQFI